MQRHALQRWRLGLVVARSSRSTKLLCTPGPISTGMGDRLQPVSNQPIRPTQPSSLSGTENEYQSKRGDAVRMGSKGRYGSFHLWINVWINLCDPSLTRAIPEHLRGELLMIERYKKSTLTLLTYFPDSSAEAAPHISPWPPTPVDMNLKAHSYCARQRTLTPAKGRTSPLLTAH